MRINSHLKIEPLTAATWPKFEELFGRKQGANGGCWCMWWRLPRSDWQELSKEQRRISFKATVERGEPTGILLIYDEAAIGWCAVTPHSALPTFARSRISKAIDEKPSWCTSCFFIKAGHRSNGHMKDLIRGAIWFARRNGAVALDAFPQEMNGREGYVDTFVGVASCFRACGFTKMEQRGERRSAMRLNLI
jgi:hypothetical protein